MRVGVPREIKNHEYRVGLTPHSVAELRAHGHEDWVEIQAGAACCSAARKKRWRCSERRCLFHVEQPAGYSVAAKPSFFSR